MPCGHAIAVIQTYRSPDDAQARRSARDLVACNLTVATFHVTYGGPVLPPVETATLAPYENDPCRAPLFKKARGRPQTARLLLESKERDLLLIIMGGRNIPDRVQRCSPCREEGRNVEYFAAQLPLLVCSLRGGN